jgi:opacity protein-like surface antigen
MSLGRDARTSPPAAGFFLSMGPLPLPQIHQDRTYIVRMKETFALLFCIVLAAGAASAQAVYSGSERRFALNVGAEASAFQPDYAGAGVAQTSPNRLYGMGGYVDVRFNRWIQLEAEARWLNFNEYLAINETSYMVGPRLPIHRFGRATPYAKFLYGMGSGSFLTGNASAYAFGGGVDYRLSKKFTLRAFDFEYQSWNANTPLKPYGASAGLSYKIF